MDDQQFLFKQDWVPYPGIEVSDVEGKAVFAGYGIHDPEALRRLRRSGREGSGRDVLAGEPGSEKKDMS